ncbi:sodium/proton antiporter NhaA [Helicobacter muridarum]|uniref:Na(+)/H(+) antiporter NhaA n=1 Tax=Helicobacter muridarum TaxID=216 RepID=A0A099TYR3_9HELI|nr:sodium/proton antiporter NhaA [Helicobacter muridarum]TLE00342.1 sodium/proton antiporter NhaA [Helicobacter muridarum]STQ85845.1 sodium/proton antiporter [Helicobacter muridarum]
MQHDINKKGNTTQMFIDFVRSESFGGIFLAFSTILALIVANSSFGDLYQHFFHTQFGFQFDDHFIGFSIHDWINDVLMAFFFLLVGLEIKREMIFGELNSFSKAAFPAIAAVGGMIVPGLIYYYLNMGTPSAHGFGIPMATDIAFALGVIMVLGSRVPIALKVFLVTLAVVDDLGAIVVIALFYGGDINLFWLMMSGFIILLLIIFNNLGIKSLVVYLIFGVFLWFCVHASGVHATIAAVALAFCIPLKAKYKFSKFEDSINRFSSSYVKGKDDNVLLNSEQLEMIHDIQRVAINAQNPLLRLEHFLQPWSAYFIMPLFAFANAGVNISGNFDFNIDHIFWGIFLGLVVGKPVGVLLATFACEKFGIASRPNSIGWGHILGAGMLAGIGFTMSLFVSALAFDLESSKELSKISILLASLFSCVIGVIFLLFYGKIKK